MDPLCFVWLLLLNLFGFLDRRVIAQTQPEVPVRLAGGLGDYEGRVEVFHDNAWGTVCDNWWGLEEAEVVCRQLGFIGADLAVVAGKYGPGDEEKPIWLDMVECNGTENNLFECQHSSIGVNRCSHSKDAGVICTSRGSLRLTNKTQSHHGPGRVEILDDAGTWNTICANNWNSNETRVACRQLGFSSPIPAYIPTYPDVGLSVLNDLGCNGSETRLDRCPNPGGWGSYDCLQAGVVCDPRNLRIVSDQHPEEGRVEVFYGDTWGTICDNQWDINDAHVVCKTLGFSRGAEAATTVGGGSGPILLDNVDCVGNETAFPQCPNSGWAYTESCTHDNDAGVKCKITKYVNVIDGEYPGVGRVRVFYSGRQDSPFNICNKTWDINDADVVCRDLGFPRGARAAITVEGGTGSVLLDNIECSGNESSFSECSTGWTNRQNCPGVAGVVCYGHDDEVVRLLSGGGNYEGVVEYREGANPGLICDSDWSDNEASVICRQLGYQNGSASKPVDVGKLSSGSIFYRNYNCKGNEVRLEDCKYDASEILTCSPSDVAQVVCGPFKEWDTRLVGGHYTEQGRVEVFLNDQWGAISNTKFSYGIGDQLCNFVGYQGALQAYYSHNLDYFGQGTGPIWIYELQCSGVNSLQDCFQITLDGNATERTHKYDLAVVCYPYESVANHPVRLISETGEINNQSGRVEIFHDGVWGNVCFPGSPYHSPKIICRDLGYEDTSGAGYISLPVNNVSVNPVSWFDVPYCSSSNAYLYNCRHSPWGSPEACNDTSGMFLGITCNGSNELPTVFPTSHGHLSAVRGIFQLVAFVLCSVGVLISS